MVKKVFGITVLACLGLAAIAGLNRSPVEAKATEPDTVDIYGTHNYFNGNGGVWSSNQLLKDQDDGDGVVYTRLTTTGGDNCYLLMDSDVKSAGNYIFTAEMRVNADYNGENVGFGFWAGGSINGRIHDTVIASQLKAGEWAHVEVKFELNESEANAIDSIHLWCLQANAYVDFHDMAFRQLLVGVVGDHNYFNGNMGDWEHGNLEKGVTESELTFNRLSKTASGDNCYILMDSEVKHASEYIFRAKMRAAEGFTNIGFGFWAGGSINARIHDTVVSGQLAAGEWKDVVVRLELTEAEANAIDSIHMWCLAEHVDFYNMEFNTISLLVDERPEFEGGVYAFEWNEKDNADLAINVTELHGYTDVVIKNGEYVLEENVDYTFAAGVLTIKKEFLADFDDGIAEFVISTSGGERQFTVEITHVQEDLPNVADYELVETVFGGDFMDLAVGYTMSEDQTEYAWGAVSNYDDGGVVIEEADGSHALSFKKPEGSTKSYASSFVIYHPEKIVEHTIVTMAFDYKYTGANTDAAVNVCWVGSSNVSYHLINLNGSKPAKTAEPAAKYRQWDIQYTELENGYTHVVVSMRIDAATVTATNSIRFLMKYNGSAEQELRLQNMSLKKWVKSLGNLNPTEAAFNKAQPADVATTAKFAEGLQFYALAIDSKTTYVAEANYTVANNADGSVTVTLKKEYLATLTNGEHTFYVSSSENADHEYAELEFKVTISGEAVPDTPDQPDPQPQPQPEPEQPAKKGCKGSIIATSALISTLALAGFGLLISKKRK